MATKQEVADYINDNWDGTWTEDEKTKMYSMLDPELARIWIKLIGDVSFLVEVRDNASNNY